MISYRFALICCLFLASTAHAEDYTGLVYPLHNVTLSIGVGGVVSKVEVQPGRQVRAGEVLMVLDDRQQTIEADRRKVIVDDNSEIKATEDRTRIQKSLYDDAKTIFEKTGSVSRDELQRLELEYVTARGRLDQLMAQKKREKLEFQAAEQERVQRQLTAPVAGVITRLDLEVGEWAKQGEPLIHMVDASVCLLQINVPLLAVQGLHVGMPMTVNFEPSANAAAVQGKLTFLSPIADPASGLVELRVTFSNPGMAVRPGVKGIIKLGGSAGTPAKGTRS